MHGTALYREVRRLYWTAACRLMVSQARGRVHSGPFRGMAYGLGAVWSASLPKLLGTYELELHDTWKEMARTCWGTLVDVGAAEGYYAVGAAVRGIAEQVIAYEADPEGRRLLAENVARNAARVEQRGHCSAAELADTLAKAKGPTLVVLDVEGAEADMLAAVPAEQLAAVTLIVEVHDFHTPPGARLISLRLREQLEQTHAVEMVRTRPRMLEDFPPAFRWVPRRNRFHAMDEYRPAEMGWLVCRPRAR